MKALLLAFAIQAVSLSLLPAQQPEYVRFYDPATGFKPAQSNLSEIFLQIAGSLEESGSPKGYIRHMQAEYKRIAAEFEAKTGKPANGHRPDYMTDEYLDRVIANWNVLSPKLHLDELAKEAGHCAREGIRGTRDTGTLAVKIFNDHQEQVFAAMKSGEFSSGDFEHLRATLAKELEYGKPVISMVGYDTNRRDAVSYAIIFDGKLKRLFERIEAAMPGAKAQQLEAAITGVFLDLGALAQCELELGILDSALRH